MGPFLLLEAKKFGTNLLDEFILNPFTSEGKKLGTIELGIHGWFVLCGDASVGNYRWVALKNCDEVSGGACYMKSSFNNSWCVTDAPVGVPVPRNAVCNGGKMYWLHAEFDDHDTLIYTLFVFDMFCNKWCVSVAPFSSVRGMCLVLHENHVKCILDDSSLSVWLLKETYDSIVCQWEILWECILDATVDVNKICIGYTPEVSTGHIVMLYEKCGPSILYYDMNKGECVQCTSSGFDSCAVYFPAFDDLSEEIIGGNFMALMPGPDSVDLISDIGV
ncbi:hypothetical protein KI387_038377, partial [Taxus chinensis]